MKLGKRVKTAWKVLTNKSTNPSVSLNELYHFLGIDPNTDEDALAEATYFACIKLLSEALGKLPLKLLRYNERNGVVAQRDHPFYRILHDRPNPYMTASAFWSTVEYYRNDRGNAYVWIRGAGEKMTLWILPTEDVTVYYDDAKVLGNQLDIYYRYSIGGKTYTLGSEEVLHFRSFNSRDGITGISVRDQLKSTIAGASKSQRLVERMYDSGFTAKAILNYTGSLSDANVQTLIDEVTTYARGGLNEDGIIIPMPVGYSLTPLNTKLADNQFIEVKQYTSAQIASAFGIKPYQYNDLSKSSYSSAEAQQLSFYVDTLLFILKHYEEELSYKLLSTEELNSGYHFKFNISVILRADLATQIDTLSKGVANFIYTPNEARAMLDLEAKEGGDRLLGNGSSIPVELTGIQYQKDSAGEESSSPTDPKNDEEGG